MEHLIQRKPCFKIGCTRTTAKHENGYIEKRFSTNIQAENKRKTLLSYSKKKKSNTRYIYIYIYTKTNNGLPKTCKAESPNNPLTMTVSVP